MSRCYTFVIFGDKVRKIKLAKLYEKVNNIKTDFLHKLTHQIVNESQIDYVFVEDLNVRGMLKNHKLARSISAASWNRFYTYLKYKVTIRVQSKGKGITTSN